jgi:hypothetical protein
LFYQESEPLFSHGNDYQGLAFPDFQFIQRLGWNPSVPAAAMIIVFIMN